MPIISVIIPVYNGEKTIKATIESVLMQSFTDLELIVINADSKDATLAIISQIEDPRIRIFSYPKANVAVNRNRGLCHAHGEFISFIDADDLWTKDKLELQYKVLQENPQAAVAYSWTDHIDEDGKFLRAGSRITASGNVYPQLLLGNFLENGSNPLICKQALVTVGGFDEQLTNSQDKDMWLRLAAHYEFVVVPSAQILYRISVNSMSADVWQLESASLQVLERAFKNSSESLQYLKPYSLANLYKYLLYKTLEGQPTLKRNILAVKFLVKSVINDFSLLKTSVVFKVLFKILTISLLPSPLAYSLFAQAPKIFNTSTLLGYISFDIISISKTTKTG